MKIFVLIFSLIASVFATPLYKSYQLGQDISSLKNIERATISDTGYFPQKETAEIKYYKSKTNSNEFFMVVKNQLFAVIYLDKDYDKDIISLSKFAEKELKTSKYLGTNVTTLNKLSQENNNKQFQDKKKGRDFVNNIYSNSSFLQNTIVYVSEIYKADDRRAIVLVGKDFDTKNPTCKTCEFIEGVQRKTETVALIIFAP